MVCGKCGAQAQENAVFCAECGARLDGKKACPACEQLVDDTSKFCVFCGARIDGKTKCAVCGTEYAGAFCPNCGNGAKAGVKKAQPTEKTRSAEGLSEDKKSRLFGMISGGIALLGAVCALIFIFFTGLTYTVTSGGVEESVQELTLFYFFGDVYKNVESVTANIRESVYFHGLYGGSIYFWAVLGTVIAALSLLSVVTFAVVGSVRYTCYCLGAGTKNGEKCSLFAVLSLFVGGGALFALINVWGKINGLSVSSGGTSVVSTAWNGATVAGQVLGAVTLGLYVVCKLISCGKELLSSKKLARAVTCAVGLGLLAVVFCMAKNTGLHLTVNNGSNFVKMGLSYLQGAILLLPSLESGLTVVELDALESSLTATVVCSGVAQVVTVLLLAAVVFSLYQQIKGVKEEHSALAWSVVTVIISVALTVFSVIASLALKATAGESGLEISVSLAKQFVTMIFAVLYMVLCIVQKALTENVNVRLK